MNDYLNRIDLQLMSYIPLEGYREQRVLDAMRYSLSLPGKRVRPTLTLEFAVLCGGSVEAALPFACGVEMIHTYSLIHDDLPAMDDDDYRRGQLSNHKVFGEDIAILAGDALQSLAFQVMLSDESIASVGAACAARAARVLAQKSGMLGMVGGQVIDVEHEGKHAPVEVLREMDAKKTACLIEAACMMGCISAGASQACVLASERYAHAVGLAFQIMDDILDVTSTTEQLGKPVGSDADNDKSTYVSLLGLDRCRELVDELTDEAIDALSVFEGDTSSLSEFARALARRNK